MKRPTRQKFDPRLKAAMAEICDVLKRYDIGGQVVIASTIHSEFLTHFPTWSIAQFSPDEYGAEMVHVNNTGGRFTSDQTKNEMTEATAHMLSCFFELAMRNSVNMCCLVNEIEESFGVSFADGTMSEHDLEGELASRGHKNIAPKPRHKQAKRL